MSIGQTLSHWLRRPAGPSAADWQLARAVSARRDELAHLSDGELAERAAALRRHGPASPSAIPSTSAAREGLALAALAAQRRLGQSPYPVQLLGAAVLARGAVGEMQTGEGKTLTTALAAALLAATGRRVHLATVNSYLAQRDAEHLRPFYAALGIGVGLLRDRDTPEGKRAAYAAEVTYGMGYEFGFDYLRDQLARRAAGNQPSGHSFLRRLRGQVEPGPETVQREHDWALIDEIDAVLIDEGRTPLVISGGAGPADDAPAWQLARDLARRMVPDRDFAIAPDRAGLWLTPQGQSACQRAADSMRLRVRRPWQSYVEQSLRAHHLLARDVDYLVDAGQVKLIDQQTGRIFADRTWRDGLHQAVEAKEGLAIRAEAACLARISRQRYFRRYRHLAGLTGTATGTVSEFQGIYRLPVFGIPRAVASRRVELPDRVAVGHEEKLRAVADEVVLVHATGRPVLVGSRTIAQSEQLASLLRERGVVFQLLNGRQDAAEHEIVAGAGQLDAVTVATNMAGRGTDICLAPAARERGGLHVIGLERHRSRRVDRQLLGRAGRQGDPGSGRFYLCREDELFRSHGPTLGAALHRFGPGELPARHPLAARVARLQRKVERADYRQRLELLAHDDWLDTLLGDLDGRRPAGETDA